MFYSTRLDLHCQCPILSYITWTKTSFGIYIQLPKACIQQLFSISPLVVYKVDTVTVLYFAEPSFVLVNDEDSLGYISSPGPQYLRNTNL